MGVHVEGMREWLLTLDELPEKAKKAFNEVMLHAGLNIKDDWTARWKSMPHAHIPHLVRLINSENPTNDGFKFSVVVGVLEHRPQSRFASFIEYGTLTSGPHPGGLPSLEAEAPRMAEYAAKVAQDLLEGRI